MKEKHTLIAFMDVLASCAFLAANSDASCARLAKSENEVFHMFF